MDVQIAVKDIQYSFGSEEVLPEVREFAEQAVMRKFNDEQDKFRVAVASGDIADCKEYAEEIGFDFLPSADYTKSFVENSELPEVKQEITKYCNTYMRNVRDLPKDTVVTIDNSFMGKDGADETAVRSALKEKYGVTVIDYTRARVAEKSDLIADNAYTKIGDMMKSNDYLTYLNLRASIEKYSSSNISLIYSQMPNAKAVMGLKAWNAFDRQVDKGSHGISIWQPTKREFKTERQIDDYIKKNIDYYDGDVNSKAAVNRKASLMKELEETGKAEMVTGFKLGCVFDVSQTTCNDRENDLYQAFLDRDKPLNAHLNNFEEVIKAISTASLAVGNAGMYKINIPINVPAEQQQDAIYKGVLDYTKQLLGEAPSAVKGIKSTTPLTGDMHEIEAIVAAHLICKHIGIDCDDKANIQLVTVMNNKMTEQTVTIGQRQMFMQAFDRACKLNDQFVKDFDKEMGVNLEQQKTDLKERAAQLMEERRNAAIAAAKMPPPRRETDPQNANRLIYRSKKGVKWGTIIQDEWRSQNTEYLLLEVEKNGKYLVDVTTNGNSQFLKDSDGEAIYFDKMPSRADVERLAKNQNKTKQVEYA